MLVGFSAPYGVHSNFAVPVNLTKPSSTNFGRCHAAIRAFQSSGEHGSIASSNGPSGQVKNLQKKNKKINQHRSDRSRAIVIPCATHKILRRDFSSGPSLKTYPAEYESGSPYVSKRRRTNLILTPLAYILCGDFRLRKTSITAILNSCSQPSALRRSDLECDGLMPFCTLSPHICTCREP